MNPISIQQICQAVSGQIVGVVPETLIHVVSTDTRQMKPASLFIAIKGETHDGHDHLAAAATGGAIAALVERIPTDAPQSLSLIQVQNTRRAMARLASFVRQQLHGTVIAVGGSNGKTGTKHLIDSALRRHRTGTISPKSFNNDIGVPLAIFPASPTQDYLVLEMGTNHPGEIRVLTDLATPDVAVITNISAEHLEGLGDLDGVRREEASIIHGLKPTGLLIVNGDDAELLNLTSPFPGRRTTFGIAPHNDLHPTDIRLTTGGTRFRLNGTLDIFIPLLGRHIAVNSLAAIAVARHLGLTDQQIADSLAHATGPDMRLQLQRLNNVTLLNDAYNANPASMKAALDTLCDLPAESRRIAILGDMRELGDSTDDLHREVGVFAAEKPLDLLICVGEKSSLIASAAQRQGFAGQLVHYPDAPAASLDLPAHLQDGDLVLLKASRSMRLERLVTTLAERRTGQPA